MHQTANHHISVPVFDWKKWLIIEVFELDFFVLIRARTSAARAWGSQNDRLEQSQCLFLQVYLKVLSSPHAFLSSFTFSFVFGTTSKQRIKIIFRIAISTTRNPLKTVDFQLKTRFWNSKKTLAWKHLDYLVILVHSSTSLSAENGFLRSLDDFERLDVKWSQHQSLGLVDHS